MNEFQKWTDVSSAQKLEKQLINVYVVNNQEKDANKDMKKDQKKKETKILNKILDFSHRVCAIVGPIQKGQGGVIKSVQ